MSAPAAKRSYEELEAICAKLEAESGRNLVMQQDLIHAKGQVDGELMRFKAIQAFIAKALEADDPDEFFSLTLESVIEAFEYEVALFLQAAESDKLLLVSGEFGFEEAPGELPFSPKWLKSDESEIVAEDDFLLMAWTELDLAKAIVCPFHDKNGKLAGIILGGITKQGADLFEDIDADHCSAFTVMVQQAGSLWTNRELNDEIRQQNAQLVSLTDSYSRFVPFQFLELLNRASIEEIDAGDHVSLETSVLFADIRDFTSLSKALGPAGTFSSLNEFLVAVEPVVEQEAGFLNQYLGDAIMALFPGQADAALRCAIRMIAQSRELNARRSGSGELTIRFGMGISSGPLMLGAIGGGKRLDSNVVGDTANLASRIEGLTRLYGVSTLFTETTRARLENQDEFCFRELDRVVVKGRSAAVSIYELYDCDTGPIQAQKHATAGQFANALELYREAEFKAALDIFKACAAEAPDDNVAKLYIDRCNGLISNPPAEPWQGVWILDQK